MRRIGAGEGLHFDLSWDEERPSGNAADATEGCLLAWIGDRLVWGLEEDERLEGIRWSWVELLDHLARAWPRIEFEEAAPLDLNASDPAVLRVKAEERWLDMPDPRRDEEQSQLWAFEDAHDLSRALQGAWPEPLWILREGSLTWVSTRDLRIQRPADETISTLVDLGQAIVARLATLSDVRAKSAIEAWEKRKARSTAELLSFSTGLGLDIVKAIAGDKPLADVWGVPADGFEVNELQAAARMAGPGLSVPVLRKIVQRIRSIDARPTSDLDPVSARAQEVVRPEVKGRPFEQGHTLAEWFRSQQGVASADGYVDVERILRKWSIRALELTLDDESVDAVACWGPRHGPAVFVNVKGRHARDLGGRRATLAHEIAHLLVDRAGALPLAEVRGGRTPAPIEARASAFAAELLLPRRIAGESVALAKEPKRAVARLCKQYGVSRELVAWQARNSGSTLSNATFAYLRSLVTEPRRFISSA